jgi:hypothetical protein
VGVIPEEVDEVEAGVVAEPEARLPVDMPPRGTYSLTLPGRYGAESVELPEEDDG